MALVIALVPGLTRLDFAGLAEAVWPVAAQGPLKAHQALIDGLGHITRAYGVTDGR